MINFSSFEDFGNFIMRKLLREMPSQMHNNLEAAGKMLEQAAKAKLGHYQEGWPPLDPDTIRRKRTGDSPLLETGELRDSIHHVVIDHPGGQGEVYVGSDDDKALYHELGTYHIPPRPFLTPTAMEMGQPVADMIGARTAAFLRTGEVREISNAEYERHKDVHHGIDEG